MNILKSIFDKLQKKDNWHTTVDPLSMRTIDKNGQLTLDSTGDKSEIKDYAIKSTCVKGFTWNPQSKSLYLQFVGGNKEYEFPGVPEKVIEQFENAPSKGRFYNSVIKEYSSK